MYGMSRSRSESAITSEPQPGVLAGVRLAGRSISLRDGWGSVEISAAGAGLAVAVLTGQSLFFWRNSEVAGGHKTGSARLTQPHGGGTPAWPSRDRSQRPRPMDLLMDLLLSPAANMHSVSGTPVSERKA